MPLFGFNPADILSFLLTLLRVSLVIFVLPFFNGRMIPNPVKAALCLVLALALWPALRFPAQAMPADLWSIGLMLLGEVTLGLIMSLAVNVLFAAASFGGSLISFQMGYTMVSTADPLTGSQEDSTAYFMNMLALMTFLGLDGHLRLLAAFGDSFGIIPPGGLYVSAQLGREVLWLTSQIFVLAVRLAAPVLVAVFLVDLAIALVGRVSPQLNVMTFGFPIKMVVGFVFLGMLFTVFSRFVGAFMADMPGFYRNLFNLAAGPR